MNSFRNKAAFWGVVCGGIFVFAYHFPDSNLAAIGGLSAAVQPHLPGVHSLAAKHRSAETGKNRYSTIAHPEQPPLREIGDTLEPQEQDAGFSYTDAELERKLIEVFGTPFPSFDQISRRQREKFFEYLRKVSINSPAFTEDRSASRPAEDSLEGEIENPYTSLKNQAIAQPEQQETGQNQSDSYSGETRSERYIKLAAESAGLHSE